MKLSMISGIIHTEVKVWIILNIMHKPNPIIVLYIQNSHTKMQAKCGSKNNFVIFARVEAVMSSASNNFFVDTFVQ